MPFDFIFKPVDQDEEVWFGVMLHGWWAKATEPLHWLIYGFGTFGFLRMKPWMFPWAALYTFQVAVAMLVWSILYGKGSVVFGVLTALPFVFLGVKLWQAKTQFNGMVGVQVSGIETTDG